MIPAAGPSAFPGWWHDGVHSDAVAVPLPAASRNDRSPGGARCGHVDILRRRYTRRCGSVDTGPAGATGSRDMSVTDLITPEAVIPHLKVASKKAALQELAARAAELSGQDERAVLEVLMQREKLGSTAVGNGIAIPHGKLPKLDHLFGLFARVMRPIDFEALDNQPVDLIFLLLAPEGAGADHLRALAQVARLLREPAVARQLRDSDDAEAIYAVLTQPPS